jgi:putative ABC transport system permease protein
VFDLHGQKVAAYLVGYVLGEHGGPWALAHGRALRSDNEVVVDSALAQRHRLRVGNTLDVGGHAFRIVGLSAGTSASMTGFVFVTHTAADTLLRTAGTTSYVLVGTQTPAATAQRLRAAGLTVFTSHELGANDRQLMTGIFGAPLNLMVGVAFVAGTLIVAMTVYASVLQRRREYGVIKAIGGTRRRIVEIVVRQALVLSFAGLVVGGALFIVGRALLHSARPQFSVVLTTGTFVRAVVAAVVMALLASVMPARSVANAQPAEVYRSST